MAAERQQVNAPRAVGLIRQPPTWDHGEMPDRPSIRKALDLKPGSAPALRLADGQALTVEKCRRTSPIFHDYSNGKLGNPFTGRGAVVAACHFCAH